MASFTTTIAQARKLVLGVFRKSRVYRIRRDNVPINSANTDVAILGLLPSKWRPLSFTVFEASGTPVLGTLALYTAAAAGGNNIVAAAVLTTLTSAAKVFGMTLALTDYQTSSTAYVRNVAANVAALTVSVDLEYEDLS